MHGILEAQTSKASCRDSYLPKRPCGFPEVALTMPARLLTQCQNLSFRKWGCGLSLDPLRGQGHPGAAWQHRQHPYRLLQDHHPPFHLMLIQTCSQPLVCALNTKLSKKMKYLGSPQLNTQEKGLSPPPRLHSLLPSAMPSAHPTDARLCPRRTVSLCYESNQEWEQGKRGQDWA